MSKDKLKNNVKLPGNPAASVSADDLAEFEQAPGIASSEAFAKAQAQLNEDRQNDLIQVKVGQISDLDAHLKKRVKSIRKLRAAEKAIKHSLIELTKLKAALAQQDFDHIQFNKAVSDAMEGEAKVLSEARAYM